MFHPASTSNLVVCLEDTLMARHSRIVRYIVMGSIRCPLISCLKCGGLVTRIFKYSGEYFLITDTDVLENLNLVHFQLCKVLYLYHA